MTSTVSHVSTLALPFTPLLFAWRIYFSPLDFQFILCLTFRQTTQGSFFFFYHSVNVCLLIGASSLSTLKVITEKHVLLPSLLNVFCLVLFYLRFTYLRENGRESTREQQLGEGQRKKELTTL